MRGRGAEASSRRGREMLRPAARWGYSSGLSGTRGLSPSNFISLESTFELVGSPLMCYHRGR